MPCIFLMWQWVMLGNSFLLVKKKQTSKRWLQSYIFIKKAVGIPKAITCDVNKHQKGYLPNERPCLFMNFWIQPLLATNKSWIVGSTFHSSNVTFTFAQIIYLETWSMYDLRVWIHLRTFSSIFIITGFGLPPSSLFFVGALAVISWVLLIHSVLVSSPILEVANFMERSWANLATSLL